MDVDQQKVLQLVKRPRWARHLLEHERNERVINTSGAYYHLDAEGKYRVLSGLLPRLKQTYWPHSTYQQMMKQAKRTPRKDGESENKGRFGGLVRGSRVHKQLHDFVLLDRKNFKKTHKKLDAFTARILSAVVDKLKLQPFLPEFDVYDEAMGVGTSVDLIALDSDGKLALVEYKTGYKRSYTSGADGFMARTLHRMPCTPQNQATLQVMGSALILNKCYGVPLHEMRLYVMRCDDAVVEVNPVPQTFVTKLADSMYNDLLSV